MTFRQLTHRLILMGLTALPLTTSARLGESERECFNRYSSARPLPPGIGQQEDLIPGAPHLNYIHAGWLIRVAFLKGRVAAEEYRKLPPYKTGFAITGDEMTAILEAEKGAGTWERYVFGPGEGAQFARVFTQFIPMFGQKVWKRDPDGAGAGTNPGHHCLFLWTPEAADIVKKSKEAKEAAKKKAIPKF